ncbi:MAG: hypothetical protein RSD32_04570, partial [Oscillospiraceae bacterium]
REMVFWVLPVLTLAVPRNMLRLIMYKFKNRSSSKKAPPRHVSRRGGAIHLQNLRPSYLSLGTVSMSP